MSEVLIELSNARKTYYTKNIETSALNDVSLSIEAGEFVAIMGPSGCGKSTLMSAIGLLDRLDGGSYRFAGEEMTRASANRLTDLRRDYMGFVFQSFNLIDQMTVYENVELALSYRGAPKAERRSQTEQALENMSLGARHSHYPSQLSGGQQQRVALARAIVTSPEVILADEPAGNLDARNRDDVLATLKDLNARGATVIMVTHSEHDAGTASRVVRMSEGRIVAPVDAAVAQ